MAVCETFQELISILEKIKLGDLHKLVLDFQNFVKSHNEKLSIIRKFLGNYNYKNSFSNFKEKMQRILDLIDVEEKEEEDEERAIQDSISAVEAAMGREQVPEIRGREKRLLKDFRELLTLVRYLKPLLREQKQFLQKYKDPIQVRDHLRELMSAVGDEAKLLYEHCLIGDNERELLRDVEKDIEVIEGLVKAFQDGKTVITRPITVLITNRCPWRCGHCSEDAGPNKNDFLDLKIFLERFKDIYGDIIMFSGGEPFSSPGFYDNGNYPLIRASIGHFRDIIICTTLPQFTEVWHPEIKGNSEKKILEIFAKENISIGSKELRDGRFLKKSDAIRQQLYNNNATFRAAVDQVIRNLDPIVGHARLSMSANRFLAASDKFLWQRIQVQLQADKMLRAHHGILLRDKILYYCIGETDKMKKVIMLRYGIELSQARMGEIYQYGRATKMNVEPPPGEKEAELVIRPNGLVYNNKYDSRSDPQGKLSIGNLYKSSIQEIVKRKDGKVLVS